MYLPTTKQELTRLGWDKLDIILVTGDTYIDTPYSGAAVVGKALMAAGFKVGIIAQPDINSPEDITRLGEPKLYWGVTSGAVDSMVANYTALKKKRRSDDSTPGGLNTLRPDRAVIRYVNLIKAHFKNTCPIVIGGLEASLRRITHYDYWADKIRKPVLLDAKADILVYGEGERTAVELAQAISEKRDIRQIRGICHASDKMPDDFIQLPSYEEVAADKMKFVESFEIFYRNQEPESARGLAQKCGSRWLVQNPPNYYLTSDELDKVHELDFERDAHPFYKQKGVIKALDTIRFSIITHRGCFGECNFCAITVHQGRRVRSRSQDSIVREVKKFTQVRDFKGIINDLGGPTANMFSMGCKREANPDKLKKSCPKRCIDKSFCKNLNYSHEPLIQLYKAVRKISGVRKVFIGSGIRHDLVIEDAQFGSEYLQELAEHHVSGQLKIAPEHVSQPVLEAMGKTSEKYITEFKSEFDKISRKIGKKQFLTYYFIAAHPGCKLSNMKQLKQYISGNLKIKPEQVQIFTPTPATYSTLMYYTGYNPQRKCDIFVEKEHKRKELQKDIITF